MVSAAVIGTALGGGVAGPARSLYVGGLDVRLTPGTGGNRLGVPLDSIEVVENGPDGVSSMRFRIEDPASVMTISNGDEVFYFDHTNNLPEFRGWVQTWSVTVFGVGRHFEVTCIGVEAVLDWMLLPADFSFAATSGNTSDAAVALTSAATGIGVPLRNFQSLTDSTQARPIAFNLVLAFTGTFTATAGTSLREALRQLMAASAEGSTLPPVTLNYTVDFWFGVRLWPSSTLPTDYASMTVSSVPAGPSPGGLNHEVDGTGVTRGVYIKGGNAAGTGLIMDGSGMPGPIDFLDDSTITTSAIRDAVGLTYLSDKAQSIRGSYRRETWADTSTLASHIQAGSTTTITDAQVGLSAATYVIASIAKVYHGGGLETWTVGYGGMAPSFPRAIRRLTRGARI